MYLLNHIPASIIFGLERKEPISRSNKSVILGLCHFQASAKLYALVFLNVSGILELDVNQMHDNVLTARKDEFTANP